MEVFFKGFLVRFSTCFSMFRNFYIKICSCISGLNKSTLTLLKNVQLNLIKSQPQKFLSLDHTREKHKMRACACVVCNFIQNHKKLSFFAFLKLEMKQYDSVKLFDNISIHYSKI